MALFNDGPISGIVDLMNYETSILDVAGTEGIDTATKLQLAQDEISAVLLKYLLDMEGNWCMAGRGPVWRRKTGTGDVVVTDPLRRWHTLRTLAMVFRDAYNNQLNDRYKGKWQSYDEMQRDAARAYMQIGVALAGAPAPKPAAPTINITPGRSTAGTYYFAFSWVTAGGTEGLCSEPVNVAVTASTQVVVSCGPPPESLAGWNLYAGTAADGLQLQNDAPLAPDVHWAQATPLASGQAPGTGQSPDYWVVNDHRLRRR